MCTGRLRGRVSSARPVAVAQLLRHRFAFEKRSDDGSAKGNAANTGRESDVVWGVVFDIDPVQKPDLDHAEGLGHGYDEKTVTVTDKSNQGHECAMYYAQLSHVVMDQPYCWYKRFVVDSAQQHGLPQEYIDEYLAAPPAKNDADKQRDARNWRITC
jgi:gamma-glutamylcyclotransferase